MSDEKNNSHATIKMGTIPIGTLGEYLEPFHKPMPSDLHDPPECKIKKALDLAHDIRKFEIELFWKRATYFWTLLAAVLVVFGVVISARAGEADSLLGQPLKWFLLLIISITGMSTAWVLHLVNKGSKFWQRNWEYHVALLEDAVTGPLYKTVISSVEKRFGKNQAAHGFSVSKLANVLSFAFYLLFMVLVSICLYKSIALQFTVDLYPRLHAPLPLIENVAMGPFFISIVLAALLALAISAGISRSSRIELPTDLNPQMPENVEDGSVHMLITRRQPK
ncbi:hypothetical protein MASR1M60_33150 [Rhodocyclaceae bacterium]